MYALPLEAMSVQQKMEVIEQILDSMETEQVKINVPKWHKDVLNQRLAKFEAGAEELHDWDELKKEMKSWAL